MIFHNLKVNTGAIKKSAFFLIVEAIAVTLFGLGVCDDHTPNGLHLLTAKP